MNNFSAVTKKRVVDFRQKNYKPMMEHKVNGLAYRYVNSGKAQLSVIVRGIKNGSSSLLELGKRHTYYPTDYLTSAVNSKVISWTCCNEGGGNHLQLGCSSAVSRSWISSRSIASRGYDADNRTFTEMDQILNPSQSNLLEYVEEPIRPRSICMLKPMP